MLITLQDNTTCSVLKKSAFSAAFRSVSSDFVTFSHTVYYFLFIHSSVMSDIVTNAFIHKKQDILLQKGTHPAVC